MPIYDVKIFDTAQADIENKKINVDSISKMVEFLKSEGVREIAKRQQLIKVVGKFNIWYFRVPIKGRGSRGGGRVLYYFHGNKIFVYRLFEKKEIDDSKHKRRRVFDDAVYELKNFLINN